MPVLSFYEGYSELTFVYSESDKSKVGNELLELDAKPEIFKLPFVYSANLYSCSFSKEQFYKEVFSLVYSQLGITKDQLPGLEFYASGYIKVPDSLPLKPKKSFCVSDFIHEPYLFVGSDFLIQQGCFTSLLPVSYLTQYANFYSNYSIYPGMKLTEPRDIVLTDQLVRDSMYFSSLSSSLNLKPKKPVTKKAVFTGERLSNYEENKALSLLLMLDLLIYPGMYQLQLDKSNLLPALFALDITNFGLLSIGSAIVSPGYNEVLFKSEAASQQFFEISEDSIFILPLDAEEQGVVAVKSELGTMEYEVKGGEVGLVFDARRRDMGPVYKDVYINMIEQNLLRI
ncbi:hypothetical protein H6802_01860 [Candidatus Nomurabacteria bacterium]|uniref:Uncharacterized protein n=1 Tax=candidate division WWE3 bacterium TaxID=2053526 RepID=A0A955DZC5_UNCKA|nr:hypothetical protein [candidate division WWE3 bacterium]MCB9823677.1 hypothetical protein [Candidatus Nomurabacteria bacterium]MCB9827245.1 hypothetical protein [Candidatus Nomurabacteria bacterium]MCB9827472.1 hypothetical protein [Candidatus Nomurabacteria bacterium]HXK52594.1 hypothetical protein [bacterium]